MVMVWTKEKNEDLLNLWKNDKDISRISCYLNVSREECLRELKELSECECGSSSKGNEEQNDFFLFNRLGNDKFSLGEERSAKINIVCPQERMPFVIGKSHSVIRKISKESGIRRIHINPPDYEKNNSDYVITLTDFEVFEVSSVDAAESKLRRLCSDVYDGFHTFRFLINEDQMESLDEMITKDLTKARIFVTPKRVIFKHKEFEIQISGTNEQVEKVFSGDSLSDPKTSLLDCLVFCLSLDFAERNN